MTGRLDPTADEQPLDGGNTGVVVRVGDTVRRQAGPWTPAVQALLVHLESVGFDAAPRALGTDERGREVATYLDRVLRRMAEQSKTLEGLAEQGDPAFVRMVAEGHADRPRQDAVWFAQRRELFAAAIA